MCFTSRPSLLVITLSTGTQMNYPLLTREQVRLLRFFLQLWDTVQYAVIKVTIVDETLTPSNRTDTRTQRRILYSASLFLPLFWLFLIFTATHRLFSTPSGWRVTRGAQALWTHLRIYHIPYIPYQLHIIPPHPTTLYNHKLGSGEYAGRRSTNHTTGLAGRGQSKSAKSNVLPWNTYATLFYHVASISTPLYPYVTFVYRRYNVAFTPAEQHGYHYCHPWEPGYINVHGIFKNVIPFNGINTQPITTPRNFVVHKPIFLP